MNKKIKVLAEIFSSRETVLIKMIPKEGKQLFIAGFGNVLFFNDSIFKLEEILNDNSYIV